MVLLARSGVMPSMQIGTPDPPTVPGEAALSESDVHPRVPKFRSRRPVEGGAEAQGMEATPRDGAANLKKIQSGG